MRLGRVQFVIGNIVDLDDKEMVDRATEDIIENLIQLVFHDGEGAVHNEIVTVEDAALAEGDIPSFLRSEEEG
ncbi:MAG: hypothetical protein ACHQ0Y_04905 [Thermodesulfovibrionales bacterium]